MLLEARLLILRKCTAPIKADNIAFFDLVVIHRPSSLALGFCLTPPEREHAL
jgi:hypothetical protein